MTELTVEQRLERLELALKMSDKEQQLWFICARCSRYTGIILSALEKDKMYYCSGCGIRINIP